MGEAYFYHLTTEPLERALPKLLVAARKAGWRVVVRGRDAGRLDWLDEKLWLVPDDPFLAHGRAGGEHDADQPILLTDRMESPNAADCLMSVDGAQLSSEDVGAHTRTCVIFDGNDPSAVEGARNQWRSVTEGGHVAKYWSQETGRWQLKAESGGAAG